MSNHLKLAVEVVRAHNLMPRDKNGSSSSNPVVELRFDNQTHRTTIKQRDLDPYWNEKFLFNISNPNDLPNLNLEAHVHSIDSTTNSKSFLGKVRINGTSFVAYSDAVVCNYPLEKGSRVFSSVTGELGLKVYVTDDLHTNSPNPLRESSSSSSLHTVVSDAASQQSEEPFSDTSNNKGKKISPGNLHNNLSNSNYQKREASSSSSSSFSTPKPEHFHSVRSDFTLRERSAFLGSDQRPKRQSRHVHDLVEPMEFLFVRVVKSRDLPTKDLTGSLDPYVEVKLGNYKGVTKHFEKTRAPEWNTVFAFSRDNIQSSVLQVAVKDKDVLRDDFVGLVRFDLHDVPTRVPPDSPLAPEWHRLEGKNGNRATKGELMLSVWFGTQADESFNDAWHSGGAGPFDHPSVRSKVYHSPRLWYLRVNVIEAQDLVVLNNRNRLPNLFVKAQIESQVSRTKLVAARDANAAWNEEFVFVASEPFEESLTLSVEDRVGPNSDEVLGAVSIPLSQIEKRPDDRAVAPRWFDLRRPGVEPKRERFRSKIRLRACLEGGYHVLEEPMHHSTDLRPASRQLWKEPIGTLELGFLRAEAVAPMKTRNGRATSDTFCVAKYGGKWVRTRTVTDSLNPKYNEQYVWEVYDPATVITIGVFDNGQIVEGNSSSSSSNHRDRRIGKVRIRISTLETGRVYAHGYPLIVLHPSGVKKMGDLHLAIRFSCASKANAMLMYAKPLLPKMHYVRPLSATQLDVLRHNATNVIASRLGRAEPPLRREVIGYVTDSDSHLWSMRRSKANFFRLMDVLSGPLALARWFDGVRNWRNPAVTVAATVVFLVLALSPELILPTLSVYALLVGLWNYRFRPKRPPHMNARLSCADGGSLHPDELDEEFDTFPTSRDRDVLRMRYDRLRTVAGRIQTAVGDVASQGERVRALLSWRDPRATSVFMGLCALSAAVFYFVSLQVLIVAAGLYAMRHPRLRRRGGSPSFAVNFFRRLPARTDSIL